MFDTDSVIPLDQTFPRLPDGNRILCNEMAPRDEAAVRTFFGILIDHPIPRFELSIKHGVEGEEPIEVVRVSHSPSTTARMSEAVVQTTEGIIEYTCHHERLNKLYGQAKNGYF